MKITADENDANINVSITPVIIISALQIELHWSCCRFFLVIQKKSAVKKWKTWRAVSVVALWRKAYIVTWLSWIRADGDGAWRHEWGTKLCCRLQMHRGIDRMFAFSRNSPLRFSFIFSQRFSHEWPIRTCKMITQVQFACTDDDNRGYRNVCNMSFVSFSLAVIFLLRLFSSSAFRVPHVIETYDQHFQQEILKHLAMLSIENGIVKTSDLENILRYFARN